MLTVARTRTIFRNRHPQLRAVDAWHPSLVHLANGRWVCSFDLAEAPEAHDYRTYVSRSDDDGDTWSQPEPIVSPAEHHGSLSIRISKLRNGSLVGFGSLVNQRQVNQGLLNPVNFGYAPMRLATTRSDDDGATWEPATPMSIPLRGSEFETCHPIVELTDGRWLAPTCTWRRWDGAEPHGFKAVAFVSRDRGRTWPEWIDVRDDWSLGYANWEQSLVELRSGGLVSLTWRYRVDGGDTAPTEFGYSLDGRRFAAGGSTGFLAQTAKLVVLTDDTVLAVYRRHDTAGLWATRARVELGSGPPTWRELDTVLIWNGASSGMRAGGAGTADLSGLKFGYPSPVLRPDGDVDVAYWRRLAHVNEICSVRIAMS